MHDEGDVAGGVAVELHEVEPGRDAVVEAEHFVHDQRHHFQERNREVRRQEHLASLREQYHIKQKQQQSIQIIEIEQLWS